MSAPLVACRRGLRIGINKPRRERRVSGRFEEAGRPVAAVAFTRDACPSYRGRIHSLDGRERMVEGEDSGSQDPRQTNRIRRRAVLRAESAAIVGQGFHGVKEMQHIASQPIRRLSFGLLLLIGGLSWNGLITA